jgi:hypothetical protein
MPRPDKLVLLVLSTIASAAVLALVIVWTVRS